MKIGGAAAPKCHTSRHWWHWMGVASISPLMMVFRN